MFVGGVLAPFEKGRQTLINLCFQVAVDTTELLVLPRGLPPEEPAVCIVIERTAPKERMEQLDSVKSATKTKELGRGEGQTGRCSPVFERYTLQGEGGKVGR
jgi:hypothetical protein